MIVVIVLLCAVLIPLNSGLVFEPSLSNVLRESRVLIPLNSGLVFEPTTTVSTPLGCVLIPLNSGLVFERRSRRAH